MRPTALLALIAPLALVVACSQEPAKEPASAPAAAPETPPVLGGVALDAPLRAVGTEPFWAVEINPDGLVYSGVDRPEQRAANPGPVIQGTTAVYATATGAGTTLVVTLMDTDCSDGMSDRTYPLTARVEIGDETLNGCAAPVAFLDSTDERGEPRTPQGPAEGSAEALAEG